MTEQRPVTSCCLDARQQKEHTQHRTEHTVLGPTPLNGVSSAGWDAATMGSRAEKGKGCPMNEAVKFIASFGVPGVLLVVIMATVGWKGAAAFTVALATLGGPFGMLGGLAVLGLLGYITHALSEYGMEKLFLALVDECRRNGETKQSVLRKIEGYPITSGLKTTLRLYVQQHWPDSDPSSTGGGGAPAPVPPSPITPPLAESRVPTWEQRLEQCSQDLYKKPFDELNGAQQQVVFLETYNREE